MDKVLILKRSMKKTYASYALTGVFFFLSFLFIFLFFNQEKGSSPYGICFFLTDILFLVCFTFSVYLTLQKKEIRIIKEGDSLLVEERKSYRIPLSSLESIVYKDGNRFFFDGKLVFQTEGKKISVKDIARVESNYLALREISALKTA